MRACMTSGGTKTKRGKLVWLAFALLVIMHVTLATVTARSMSVTVDEAGHIASGITHHQQGNFASYRVNPPPARWLATLPVVLFLDPPRLAPIADEPGRRPEGTYGAELATELGPRYSTFVFVARLFNVVLSAIGLWLVFVLGRRAFGVSGALLAATVYAFDPNLLAHAAVLSSDVPASVALLAATWALIRYLRAPTSKNVFLCGALLGLAQLTKFSALVLYPVFFVVCGVAAWRSRSLDSTKRRLVHGVAIAFTSIVVLNAGYGFRGTGERLGNYAFVSAAFSGHAPTSPESGSAGNRFAGTRVHALPVPLPADYVIGIDLQRRDFEGVLRSYLNGTWHDRGFWFYYLYALVLKTPLGVLALLAWSLVRAVGAVYRRRSISLRVLALAVVPIAFFVFISSQTGFSAHLRYVLPVIPFLALGVGALGRALERRAHGHVPRAAALLCVSTSIASVLSIVPGQLSYFNAIAGGWRTGDAHLIDSNVDWGQDLGRLASWYRAHRDDGPPLYVAYFGGVDPHITGLEYRLPPAEPTAGRFAISVNFVRGMQFRAVDGAGHRVLVPEGRYTYFQQWEPIARVGTSIRIYEVSEEQAAEARARMSHPRDVRAGNE